MGSVEINEASLANCLVLVVSGNRFTCQLVRSLLRGIGIQNVEASHDLDEAREQLRYFRFNLLILDAGPAAGFDGMRFLELIQFFPAKLQTTPVVLLTAQLTRHQIERIQTLQVKHVITKPFSPAALYNHVYGALGLIPELGDNRASDRSSEQLWKI